MSMLSSQADELRTLADKLRIVSFDERANYVENVDTLYRAMGAMREAADTITSLWNSLTASEAALNKAAGNWAKADAELRGGACENVWAESGKFKCSECAMEVNAISTNTTAPRPIAFCPNCGKKVKR